MLSSGLPDANAAPRVGCLGIDVAHQDEVVVQGRRVKPVGQMVPRKRWLQATFFVSH